jgi:hypothetical protein
MYNILANFTLGDKEYLIGNTVSKKLFNDAGVFNFYVGNGTLELDESKEDEPKAKKPKGKKSKDAEPTGDEPTGDTSDEDELPLGELSN